MQLERDTDAEVRTLLRACVGGWRGEVVKTELEILADFDVRPSQYGEQERQGNDVCGGHAEGREK